MNHSSLSTWAAVRDAIALREQERAYLNRRGELTWRRSRVAVGNDRGSCDRWFDQSLRYLKRNASSEPALVVLDGARKYLILFSSDRDLHFPRLS